MKNLKLFLPVGLFFGLIVDFCLPSMVSADSMLQIPGGTYQQTCKNVRVDGYQLRASCKRLHKGWQSTSVDLRGCQGEIENWDGKLACTGNDAQGQRLSEVPKGSYRKSCTSIIRSNGMLKAQCKTISGIWQGASVPLDRCKIFMNKNGSLECE